MAISVPVQLAHGLSIGAERMPQSTAVAFHTHTQHGAALPADPALNKGTAFTAAERRRGILASGYRCSRSRGNDP